ncbi:MAG: NADH-quinone oxidoreductase subunit A [Planctomycetota bacterium]|nr:MAG: NADH-quinone oxidoreductase subunit A [Planctomycetota bacterium]REJ94848.1 MAG: NADH-quinone oxidoreductase subunit A [Planctomycetota bacterium]REK25522.1 MAG: NADH-quinone oxidoreductase subunit A [Planctomycetota bacterium]REK45953.1 MAG: NADH-quinone oxidoreductase subunit A [Planctomycetota bacterium]
MATPTAIVAYLALFTAIGFVFLFANLVIGYLVRPKDPHAEKLEIYECGEPTIGSSFVQFDLRFYVVALVFIVFDAEVAFLFPSVTVFGKLTELANPQVEVLDESGTALTPAAAKIYAELGVADATLASVAPGQSGTAAEAAVRMVKQEGQSLSYLWYSMAAILIFFVVLFIGFAYEWKTGAFEWVRSVQQERAPPRSTPAPTPSESPAAYPVLTG